jgi:glycerol-3-phosphate dehydrogenase
VAGAPPSPTMPGGDCQLVAHGGGDRVQSLLWGSRRVLAGPFSEGVAAEAVTFAWSWQELSAMELFSGSTRASNVRKLAQEQFDVLVIGGGITGAGVALDASARGYSVALVEKGDFACGTSSKSTKLVHGGIRYLPQLDFSLVHDALVERGILQQNAPFLVQPLTFVLPLYEGARRPVGVPFTLPYGIGLGLTLDMGLWLYDVMAGRRGIARHRRMSAAEALGRIPPLHRAGLKEAFLYTDAQTDDARLTVTVVRTAAQHGAVVANYAQVVGFARADGKITGAQVCDVLASDTVAISARHVINATGVYAEQVAALAGDESGPAIEPSKGVHLVVARERLGITDTAVVLPETDDGRILFVIPWGARAIIGTTDTGGGDLDHPKANAQDISYLLRHVNRLLDVHLTEQDLISVFAGYRPLVKSERGPTALLSRSHAVLQERNGLITVVGGKLTTYRKMAQDAVDVVAMRDGLPRSHPTEHLQLAGAGGQPEAQDAMVRRVHSLGLAPGTLQHLVSRFGRHAQVVLDLIEQESSLRGRLVADLPYLRAEVVFACRYEMAMRLEDVLARRTRIMLEDRDRGGHVAAEVASLMGRALGWSQTRIQAEEAQYANLIRNRLAA